MAKKVSQLKGHDEYLSNIEKLKKAGMLHLGKALYESCVLVELKSRDRTPVQYGTLRASHMTTEPVIEGDGSIMVEIQVGGPAAPYALKVHEDLHVHHRVGQAKFLQSAVLETKDQILVNTGAKVELERFLK